MHLSDDDAHVVVIWEWELETAQPLSTTPIDSDKEESESDQDEPRITRNQNLINMSLYVTRTLKETLHQSAPSHSSALVAPVKKRTRRFWRRPMIKFRKVSLCQFVLLQNLIICTIQNLNAI